MPVLEANLPETKRATCLLCGAELHDPDRCDRCDWVKGYGEHMPEAGLVRGRDLTASLLSLMVPGLGHVYKGQTKLGIVFLLGAALASFCALIFLGIIFPVPASPIIMIVYWTAVVFLAYWAEDLYPAPDELWPRLFAVALAGMIGATLTIVAAFHFLNSAG